MQEVDGVAESERRMPSEDDARRLEMARELGIVNVVEMAQTLETNQIAVDEGTIGEIHFALFGVRKPLGKYV